MSVEVSLQPPLHPLPTHSRPNSLYRPEAGPSNSVLGRSSYSPFPSINGRHDPHGLDQFLLSPEDPSWMYSQPSLAVESAPPPGPKQVKKTKSFANLRRPSPLSQPPVSAAAARDNEPPEPVPRRRSASISSTPSPPDIPVPLPALEPSTPPSRNRRQSFRRVLSFGRKSMFTLASEQDQDAKSPSPTPSTSSLLSLTEDNELPPRLYQRSNSTYSEHSTSSTISSDEVETPSEGSSPEDQGYISAKLASALAESPAKKKSILGWFGGRRPSKSLTPEEAVEITLTHETLPSRVLPDINQEMAFDDPSDLVQSAINNAERCINRGFLVEQVRRISLSKLGQLTAVSPHPWARTISRQDQVFDEIAPGLQMDQRSFPSSVNVPDDASSLYTMQRRQWAHMCVKRVLTKLDMGLVPEVALTTRRPMPGPGVRRPAYPSDFLTRPPYEERNIVLFPNGTFSPISMARPGYGVWDIDHSRYIVALCSIDQNPSTRSSPTVAPQRRFSSTTPLEAGTPPSSSSDILLTPETTESELEEIIISPAPNATHPLGEVIVASEYPETPHSSFRRPVTVAWDSSSEEEEDENDMTLASALKRTHIAQPLQPALGAIEVAPAVKAAKRVSTIESGPSSRRDFAQELARARELRSANERGEGEKRAEVEAIKRRSMTSGPAPEDGKRITHRASFAGAGSSARRTASSDPARRSMMVERDRRGRTLSAQDLTALQRPPTLRQHSLPASPTMYHTHHHHHRRSLYDAPFTPPLGHFQPVFGQPLELSHPVFQPAHHHHTYAHPVAYGPAYLGSQQSYAFGPPLPTSNRHMT